MKKIILLTISFFTCFAFAEVKIGAAAPDFSRKNQDGKNISLKDFKGKWIVLEWYNSGCPYVQKHYSSGNMQALQKNYSDKDVQWFTIATSAKGKQGYIEPAKAKDEMTKAKMNSTSLLLDSDGIMGKAYNAKVTPHMFVINPEGLVVYAGAIDSNDSADPATIKEATNYVSAALDSAMTGKSVARPTSKAYGCNVKY